MRLTEERLWSGEVILTQPFPYFAVLYAELVSALQATCTLGVACQGSGVSNWSGVPKRPFLVCIVSAGTCERML